MALHWFSDRRVSRGGVTLTLACSALACAALAACEGPSDGDDSAIGDGTSASGSQSASSSSGGSSAGTTGVSSTSNPAPTVSDDDSAPGSTTPIAGDSATTGPTAAPSDDDATGPDDSASGAGGQPGSIDDELADESASGQIEADDVAAADDATDDPMGDGDAGPAAQVDAGAEPEAAWVGHAASLENTGVDCVVPELADPEQLPQIEKLPDPFTKLDGTRMAQRSEWHCRRQELHKQAEKYIYGEKPPRPASVTGSVTDSQVSVSVEHDRNSIDFSARIVLPPTGERPFPAIINLGNSTTLGESFLLEQGLAVIYYNHYDLGVEGQPEQSRGLDNPGRFYDLYGGDHSAGLLMSWAWGASRMIDVLQEYGSEVIDTSGLGVTGCSRNGKGAFAVGVFDERIALTIPQETSTAGVPAYRIVDILNTERTDHNFFGLNWLSNDFEPFVLNATQLPVDSHEMMAMIAPRGLLILDNPHLAQFSAPAGHTAALAAAQVFTQLGVGDHISYVSAIANQQHCAASKPEYAEPLRNSIAKFLKGEDTQTGAFEVASSAMGNLAEWRDWETPTLVE